MMRSQNGLGHRPALRRADAGPFNRGLGQATALLSSGRSPACPAAIRGGHGRAQQVGFVGLFGLTNASAM